MKELLGDMSFWVGLSLGSLTILDFLLRDKHKKWLSNKAELFWLWLDEQKAGNFTILFLQSKIQRILVILTHIGMLLIISAFLLRVYFGIQINADLELGHPRIYKFQVWVDIASIIFSMLLVSKYLHPLLLKKLNITNTIKSYLLKTLKGLGFAYLGLLILLIIQLPIIIPLFDLNSVSEIENYFNGKSIVIILHIITAIISAPVMSEVFLFMFMFFMGLYWTIIVYIVIFVFRILQFLLIRIAENPKGPVIALSGVLTGIGAIIKIFLTEH